MSSRIQYDADLRELQARMARMGLAAADAVEAAMEALCTADPDAAAAVVQGDTKINQMEQEIQHLCMSLLLRQQPVAGDLRRVSATLKAVTDVERIADHAADIAEILPHLFGVRREGDPAVSRALEMGRKAHAMLLGALDAFADEDQEAAARVIADDDAVDADFETVKQMLAEEIAADPARVDPALDLLMVIKYLERIGDHAVNLAEWVQFLRTGLYKNQTMFG